MNSVPDPRDPDRAPRPEGSSSRRPWAPPEVHELPRLTELTLQTGDAVGGSGGSGGSTVF